MRRMGGLRKFMPITAGTFIVAWLAIAGIPPLSGFWSKDEILAYALQENALLYGIGLFTAFLTAYYMSRITFRTFYGEPLWPAYAAAEQAALEAGDTGEGASDAPETAASAATGLPIDADIQAEPEPPHSEHLRADLVPHESPWTMTVPLVVLAFFAATAGLLNLPIPSSLHFLEKWLDPVFGVNGAELEYSNGEIIFLLAISTVVAIAGVLAAAAIWLQHRVDVRKLQPVVFVRAWYFDHVVSVFMAGPGAQLFGGAATFDRMAVDGAVNGVGRVTRWSAARARYVQSGYVRAYALMIAVGAVLLAAWMLSRVSVWQ
jgi:NADH:ubiquinone oxidoreductase subunit 5 (subunit L)/multisubunit Na+/H+ antiporter MnhA subunit